MRGKRRRSMVVGLVVAANLSVGLATSPPAHADGGLDPSLQDTGLLIGDMGAAVPGAQWSRLRDVARDRQGRWLVLAFVFGSSSFGDVLVRYRADGSLDRDFGPRVLATIDAVYGGAWSPATLAVQPDDTIAVFGNIDVLLAPDGSFLRQLNSVGRSVSVENTEPDALALPDGTTLVAGPANGAAAISAVNATVGPSRTAHSYPTFVATTATASTRVSVDSTGRTYLWACDAAVTSSRCAVGTYTPSGEFVRTYAGDGVLELPNAPTPTAPYCHAAPVADGYLVAACDGTAGPFVNLTEYDADGQPITPYGPATVPAGADVVVEGTGRILTAGTDPTGGTDHAVFQAFDLFGQPDATFGTNGRTVLPFESRAERIEVADDGSAFAWGNLVTGGQTNWWIAQLDTTAGPALQPPLRRSSRFVPLAPARVLDTRTGLGAPARKLGAGESVTLTVGGVAGVPTPSDGLTAVVLNVTATEGTAPGFVSVWPAGDPLPTVSNLNVVHSGDTVANLVVARIGEGGAVSLLTQTGAHLVADVAGYFTVADHASAGRFQAAPVPHRVLDTRSGVGAPAIKPGAGSVVTVHVIGVGPVPATGVSAVVMNLTGTEARGAGFVTVYPADVAPPVASNLNLEAAGTRANLVIVPVGASGDVSIFTQRGADLVADVAGWFTDSTAPDVTQGLYLPIAPRRVLDTRITGDAPGPGGTVARAVGASTVVPVGKASAIVANLTATDSLGEGFVTAVAAGAGLPEVSNLNLPGPGWTVPNLAVIGLGGDALSIYSQKGTDIILDVTGWFRA